MNTASVQKGADKAIERGLIEKVIDGNKTTTWRALVSDSEIESPSIQKLNRGDSEIESLSPIKESNKEKKESAERKPDLVDMELSKLPELSIRRAIQQYFRLNVNWDTKTSRQWLEWAHGENVTAEQIERASVTWREDKAFNWQVPTLKGIFEKWQLLMEANYSTLQNPTYFKPEDDSEFVPNPRAS
jgi:arginyl-tRNA synthetase